MKTLEAQQRVRRFRQLHGRRADLILAGFSDIPAETMLSIAEEVRYALARMGVAHVSVRVVREEDDPDFPAGT